MQNLIFQDYLATVANGTNTSIFSSPFFQTFLSAFLGFGSALIVQAITEYLASKAKRKKMISNLLKELETNMKETSSMKADSVYPRPYSIPVWRGICQSGSVMLLDELDEYMQIVSIFESIEEANIIEGMCFSIVAPIESRKLPDKMLEVLLNNRNTVQERISEGIRILRGVKI